MKSLLDLLPITASPGDWPTLALDATLRVTLVLAAAALAAAVLRRASASVRHLAWASALGGALATPVLMLALPTWRVPILPAAEPGHRLPVRVESSTGLPRSIASESLPRVPVAEFTTGVKPLERRPPSEPATRRTATPGPAARSVSRPSAGTWASWLAAVWGAGAVAVMVPLLVGHASLRRLARRSTRPTEGLLAELAELVGIPLPRPSRVVLLLGDVTASPMTWGVLRPVILLPAGAEGWPRERLRAVLLHELAHVKRWDCLTQMLARLACAAYWFHPLTWLAAHRLRAESELACDDLVLQSGSRASDYATHLLDVARTLRSTPALSAVAVPMARPPQLEGRVRAILDPSRSRRVLTRRGAGLLLAAVAALWLPLSAARLGARAAGAVAAEKSGETGDGRSARSATMTVSGRVLDPDGRPVSGARVAVVGRRKLVRSNARADDQHQVLGRAEADAEGKFRLEAPRTSTVTHYDAYALAAAPGFGLGWAELNRDAESPAADVRLRAEQKIEGRLVDLQGAAAVGVTLRTSSVGRSRENGGSWEGQSFSRRTPKGLEDMWPVPDATDAEGRFRLAGIGGGVSVYLAVDDLRFARQRLSLETDANEGTKRATLALQPAMRVSGRVTCADTGEPLRDAIVMVGSGSSRFNAGGTEFRTDRDGRYEANPAPGKFVKVAVYPPAGSPYLIFERNFGGGDGVAQRVVDVAVPRGVLLTGRVTERGSDRPLAGAAVFYQNGHSNAVDGQGTIPGYMATVASGADGQYAIAVTPGKGNLLVFGPTADYVHEMKGARELYSGGKTGGQRIYAHAFVPYEAKKDQGPIVTDVALKPGVTLAGRVVGPEGQAVANAEIITTLYISPSHSFWRGDFTFPVREGRFELHGLPPDRPIKCSFLDSEHGWGTTIEVTAAMAAQGPLTVKLQPGGTAKARLIDEQGQPVAKGASPLHIVGTPGTGIDYNGESLTEEEQTMFAADEELYVNVDRRNYWQGPRSDRDGRLTMPALIPGATYRIYEPTGGKAADTYRWRDFTVEAGQTTDLGDVRVKAEGQ